MTEEVTVFEFAKKARELEPDIPVTVTLRKDEEFTEEQIHQFFRELMSLMRWTIDYSINGRTISMTRQEPHNKEEKKE